jgi:hypothetical protein
MLLQVDEHVAVLEAVFLVLAEGPDFVTVHIGCYAEVAASEVDLLPTVKAAVGGGQPYTR